MNPAAHQQSNNSNPYRDSPSAQLLGNVFSLDRKNTAPHRTTLIVNLIPGDPEHLGLPRLNCYPLNDLCKNPSLGPAPDYGPGR